MEEIFKDSSNFREIKPFEAQGEFRGENLILNYASTLPTDTLPIINFLVLLGVDYFKSLVVLMQDNPLISCNFN